MAAELVIRTLEWLVVPGLLLFLFLCGFGVAASAEGTQRTQAVAGAMMGILGAALFIGFRPHHFVPFVGTGLPGIGTGLALVGLIAGVAVGLFFWNAMTGVHRSQFVGILSLGFTGISLLAGYGYFFSHVGRAPVFYFGLGLIAGVLLAFLLPRGRR